MSYVDGFIVAVPKTKLREYEQLAQLSAQLWKEHGALSYVECQADDVPYGKLTSFPRAVQATDDEVVFFAWVTYQSREHRDQVNAKVMADPRLKMDKESCPFDMQRMIYGGFKPIIGL